MMSKTFRWLRIIGILLFVWIASQIDWLSVWTLLRDIQPGYIAGYFAVFVVALLLKVVRLRWFLSRLGCQTSFRDVYQSVVEPAFYGMITPARIGEFSKVMYLVRFGLSKKQAWSVVLIERIVDFSVLLITSISGGLYFYVLHENAMLALAFATLLILLFTALLQNSGVVFNAISIISKLVLPKSFSLFSSISYNHELGKVSTLASSIFLPISIIVLLLSFLQLSLLSSALRASVSGVYLGVAYSTSTLLALLPISVGGLGTREAIYISTLGRIGVSESIAVTISLLDGLVFGLLFLAIMFVPIIFFRVAFSKMNRVNR